MLGLFGKRRARPQETRFAAPLQAEGLVYAIGDVHGRHDLLLRLLERVLRDSNDQDGPPQVVFLGDYIDRGEGSRETLTLLETVAGWPELDTVFLMGNHEHMMLRFLHDPVAGRGWLRHGGLQTVMSYGIGHSGSQRSEAELARLARELRQALGSHLGFVEGLRLSHRSGNVLFTHAGADPALGVDEQASETLLWGCEAFPKVDRADGVWVVHGHFVVDRPAAERGRIATDTGAYFSGRLTAVRLQGGQAEFLQA